MTQMDATPPRQRAPRSFEQEREVLIDEVARLGGLAEHLAISALDAMSRRDTSLAQGVISRHRQIDDMQREVERSVVRIIALWQPLVQDVRHVISALKISVHLERIGDLSRNIAMRVVDLNQDEPMVITRGVDRMGRLVIDQLKGALDAHAQSQADRAAEIWRRDGDVDHFYDSLLADLLAYMANDPRMTVSCTNLLFVAKNVERIGDHTTKIAEIVYGLATGAELTRRTGDQVS